MDDDEDDKRFYLPTTKKTRMYINSRIAKPVRHACAIVFILSKNLQNAHSFCLSGIYKYRSSRILVIYGVGYKIYGATILCFYDIAHFSRRFIVFGCVCWNIVSSLRCRIFWLYNCLASVRITHAVYMFCFSWFLVYFIELRNKFTLLLRSKTILSKRSLGQRK